MSSENQAKLKTKFKVGTIYIQLKVKFMDVVLYQILGQLKSNHKNTDQ